MGTTTMGQSGPGSNDNEGVLHTSEISRTRISSLDAVQHHIQDTTFGGGLLICRGYSQRILSLADKSRFLRKVDKLDLVVFYGISTLWVIKSKLLFLYIYIYIYV